MSVTKLMLGTVLLFGTSALVVTTSLGINEYNQADERTRNKIKPEMTLQVIVLTISLIFLLGGIYMMYTSNARTKALGHMKALSSHIAGNATNYVQQAIDAPVGTTPSQILQMVQRPQPVG